ncbi:alpha/beta hydrolase family protein [Roseimarinus sediminis]|uniref:alpha/beta hydrolase family protein n=1 Tax=Roseimarinus sediminis TaxID=1610899 RepID=UPI003D1CF370
MKKILIIATFILALSNSYGQFSRARWDSLNKISQIDHQLMLQKLGIESLRHGPSGDPEAPNAANADESKATPYTSVPDPLVFDKGKTVKNAPQWEKRRTEIMEHLDREVYGRMPQQLPGVRWEIIGQKDTLEGDFPVNVKHLAGRVDNHSFPSITVEIQMTLTTPAVSKEAVPVMVEFGWNFPAGFRMPEQARPTWKEQLLAEGWGYAILIPTSYQDDNGAGLRSGIIGLCNKGEARDVDDWGTLKAWGWGLSRAIDYFESDPAVDAQRIGIEGLSRYGKAALVAMAYEPRVAIGFIGSSGAGGAKLLRRVFGEQVENLASSAEYHWFAPNFIKYAGPLTPDDLPVDAHHLIALCAPRPVFISVGSPHVEGNWIDGKGMFVSAVLASPVYELLGANGIESTQMPPEQSGLMKGELAFRQHEGGHTVIPNWPYFINYAKKYFEQK